MIDPVEYARLEVELATGSAWLANRVGLYLSGAVTREALIDAHNEYRKDLDAFLEYAMPEGDDPS